jgi:hypothetical protein
MRQIKTYQTASAGNLIALDKLVNRLIKDGWQPFEAPYVLNKGGEINVCQPMVSTTGESEAETAASLNAMLQGLPSGLMRPKR